jgi:hypothetical protein
MSAVRTFQPFVHLLEKVANGPDRPFASRHDAASWLSKAAVYASRSIPTLERSALRTFLPFVHLLEVGTNGQKLPLSYRHDAAVQLPHFCRSCRA